MLAALISIIVLVLAGWAIAKNYVNFQKSGNSTP